jgi:phage N-6-adenine-methyltransferase
MPSQQPGVSEQAVGTPPAFLQAVRRRFHIEEFSVDLAADHQNFVAEPYLTDALGEAWHLFDPWCWLNPPFGDLKPWVEKAWAESRLGCHLLVLVPAATGTNWWVNSVKDKAYINYLQGRLTFVGHRTPYPKDLALLVYAPFLVGGETTWKWR